MAPIFPKSAKEIDWLEYINESLVECRYKEDPTNQTLAVEDAHEAGITAKAACEGTRFIPGKGSVVKEDPDFIEALTAELKNHSKIYSDGQYTNTLFNEQAVAENYYANVLVPVVHTLRYIFKEVLELKDMKKAGYIFNIRQQQKAVNDGTRCDHYLTLDNLGSSLTSNELKLPKKAVWWVEAEDFAEAFNRKRLNAESGEYPSMVLCIIEEKKPNIVVRESFFDDPIINPSKDKRIRKGANNVDKFSPQLRYYSTEAACNFVVVTDYLNSVLLNITNTGLIRNKQSSKIIQNSTNGIAIAEEKVFPPRYQILVAAVKRLQKAGLIREVSKQFTYTNPSSNTGSGASPNPSPNPRPNTGSGTSPNPSPNTGSGMSPKQLPHRTLAPSTSRSASRDQSPAPSSPVPTSRSHSPSQSPNPNDPSKPDRTTGSSRREGLRKDPKKTEPGQKR